MSGMKIWHRSYDLSHKCYLSVQCHPVLVLFLLLHVILSPFVLNGEQQRYELILKRQNGNTNQSICIGESDSCTLHLNADKFLHNR